MSEQKKTRGATGGGQKPVARATRPQNASTNRWVACHGPVAPADLIVLSKLDTRDKALRHPGWKQSIGRVAVVKILPTPLKDTHDWHRRFPTALWSNRALTDRTYRPGRVVSNGSYLHGTLLHWATLKTLGPVPGRTKKWLRVRIPSQAQKRNTPPARLSWQRRAYSAVAATRSA